MTTIIASVAMFGAETVSNPGKSQLLNGKPNNHHIPHNLSSVYRVAARGF
jgi:hypothetical protein